MMMIVDTDLYKGSMEDLNAGLEAVGAKVECIIRAQHEEIFDMMHRI